MTLSCGTMCPIEVAPQAADDTSICLLLTNVTIQIGHVKKEKFLLDTDAQ